MNKYNKNMTVKVMYSSGKFCSCWLCLKAAQKRLFRVEISVFISFEGIFDDFKHHWCLFVSHSHCSS